MTAFGGHHQLVQVCRCREAVVIVQASLEGDTQTQVGRDEVFVGAVGVGDLGTDVGDIEAPTEIQRTCAGIKIFGVQHVQVTGEGNAWLGFKTIDTCIRSQVAVNKAQTYASGEVVGDFAGITGIKRKLIRIELTILNRIFVGEDDVAQGEVAQGGGNHPGTFAHVVVATQIAQVDVRYKLTQPRRIAQTDTKFFLGKCQSGKVPVCGIGIVCNGDTRLTDTTAPRIGTDHQEWHRCRDGLDVLASCRGALPK